MLPISHAAAINPDIARHIARADEFASLSLALGEFAAQNEPLVKGAVKLPKSESRDTPAIRNSPPFAGLFGFAEGNVSRRQTAWLATQC
jgi:hypothetical protein